MGTTEIAELLGISRQRVSQLAERADFPKPTIVLRGGIRVWEREAIEAWVAQRGEGWT